MKKFVAVLILPLALVLAGCQRQALQVETQETVVKTPETVGANVYQTEYDVDMTNFAFSVTEMQAKPGDTITLNLTNFEGTHDLVIDELDVHSHHLDEQESEILTFTIPETAEAGIEYEYYCSVGNVY